MNILAALMLYWPIWLLTFEVIIILVLYRFVLREWIVSHWEEKVKEDDGDWLIDLLQPVIDEVSENILTLAPRAVVDVIKGELLSSQGNLARVSKPDGNNEIEVGLGMAEGLLKELGLKNPNVIMVTRLAQSLMSRIGTDESQIEPNSSSVKVKTGQELLNNL